jgi:gamma-glutamyltranspeptidase/glutathione hydrolase
VMPAVSQAESAFLRRINMTVADRYRHTRFGKSGMVAAAHPLAVLAGLDALREGGNAMDACIAMAGVTSVVLPHMCGLGGDAFLIYFDAANQRISALNSSGFTGDLATPEFFHSIESRGAGSNAGTLAESGAGAGHRHGIMPQDGILSVAVPGAPMAYELALQRYGSFTLKKAFEPAARLAEEGFLVTPGFARAVFNERQKLEKYPESRRVFLKGGQAPKVGNTFCQKDLARTLREFGEGGAEYIYKGPFARQFYKLNDAIKTSEDSWAGLGTCNHDTSGPLTGALAHKRSTFTGGEFERFYSRPPEFYTPLHIDYRGYTIYQTGPVSQGFLALEQMKIIENFDIPALEPDNPDVIHLMTEAKKLAFRDRNLYAGDPGHSEFDVSRFISAGHTQRLSTLINPLKALSKDELGDGALGIDSRGDTTFFTAVDVQGNACSFIHSNAFSFGSGLVVPGTGVILNNRAGRSFVLEEGHPNCVAPGKKPMYTLNCYMVFRGGQTDAGLASDLAGGTFAGVSIVQRNAGSVSGSKGGVTSGVSIGEKNAGSVSDSQFFIAGGTPGGDGQPQWNMQMLSLMLDHGYGPQAACDFPRWLSFPGTDVLHLDKPMEVRMESRFPSETITGLGRLGHCVRTVGPWAGGGGAQIIMLDPDSGLLLGGSDRRLEGLALGF